MDSIRNALTAVKDLLAWLPDPVVAVIILVLAGAIAYSLHKWVRRLLRVALAERYPYAFSVFTQMRGVTRLGLLILAMVIAIPVAPLDPNTAEWLARLLLIAVIGLIGWAAITALSIAADLYLRQFRLDVDDNLLARKHVTQVRVLLRAADVLVVLVTVGAALMTFEPVRQYGVSLFASAGVAGIVAGLAARPVLSNLFAGVQLAMTQPIRIDDAVVVENEWGIDRGNHLHLCRRAAVGLAAHDRAALLFHREAVPELDARRLGADRQRHDLRRLPRAGRRHPRQARRDRQGLEELGRQRGQSAGHRRQGETPSNCAA